MTSIAVFVLDTLRKDSFDRHFDWLPGARFDRTYAPSHYTVPVHASLFTGRYPSTVGVGAKHEQFDCEEPSLVEEISAAGYDTAGFTANGLLTENRSFDRGFDQYHTSWRVRLMNDDVFGWSRAVREIPPGPLRDVRAVWRCLRSDTATIPSLRLGWRQKFADHDGGRRVLKMARSGSFRETDFLFVNLMEAHSPYRAPDEYGMPTTEPVDPDTILEGDVDLSNHRERYEVAVQWLSDLYKQIFETISDDFDYVFTLSDHGELFGEHGARAHFHGVYPELVHVPLCVSGFNDDDVATDSTRSLLDVHRTIADLMNIQTESEGVDLRKKAPDRDCFTEYHGFRRMRRDILSEYGFAESTVDIYDQPLVGHVSDGQKYAYQRISNGERDSTEARAELEDRAEIVEAAIKQHVSTDQDLSEDALEQLRNLGYA